MAYNARIQVRGTSLSYPEGRRYQLIISPKCSMFNNFNYRCPQNPSTAQDGSKL